MSTPSPDAAPNQRIADLAAGLARDAPSGSLQRRAAGCVAVAHATTRSTTHALRVLREHFAECGNTQLLDACERLIEELTAQAGQEVSG